MLIGTVWGDIHDIGKNIVTFMLQANGFDVLDIGVNVLQRFLLKKSRNSGRKLSDSVGLLTLAFDSMKNTIEALTDPGLRDQVKVMIGEHAC